jgi:hypothetical protein
VRAADTWPFALAVIHSGSQARHAMNVSNNKARRRLSPLASMWFWNYCWWLIKQFKTNSRGYTIRNEVINNSAIALAQHDTIPSADWMGNNLQQTCETTFHYCFPNRFNNSKFSFSSMVNVAMLVSSWAHFSINRSSSKITLTWMEYNPVFSNTLLVHVMRRLHKFTECEL